MHVIVPELVLDEESDTGTYGAQETQGIGGGVDGEVADEVSEFVVLAYFVARGGEEGEEDLLMGIYLAILLYDGTPLLELTEGGGMEPCVVGGRVHVVPEVTEGGALASPHLLNLVIEETGDEDSELEYVKYDVVHCSILAPLWRDECGG